MVNVLYGVVPAISSIVRKMTTIGENVLIQSPVYNIFIILLSIMVGMSFQTILYMMENNIILILWT